MMIWPLCCFVLSPVSQKVGFRTGSTQPCPEQASQVFNGEETEALGGLAWRHTAGVHWGSEGFSGVLLPLARYWWALAPDCPEENRHFGNSALA